MIYILLIKTLFLYFTVTASYNSRISKVLILTDEICYLSLKRQRVIIAITKSPYIMSKCLGSVPM